MDIVKRNKVRDVTHGQHKKIHRPVQMGRSADFSDFPDTPESGRHVQRSRSVYISSVQEGDHLGPVAVGEGTEMGGIDAVGDPLLHRQQQCQNGNRQNNLF